MKPTQMEEYLFDLRGFLVLEQVLDSDHVAALNSIVDPYMDMAPDSWRGWVHRQGSDLHHLHNVFEMGEPFERLIDWPGWLGYMERFISGNDGLFIDESFVDIRGPGQATRLHSGAHKRRVRTQFRYHDGQFRCGQINILLALTDIGPGAGPTMAIPGSHKSNLIHPGFAARANCDSVDGLVGAEELHLQAGDALFFVDCLAHGSARRRHEGERRVVIIRYGPSWGNDRYGYQPSPALLARLPPAQRQILQPLPPRMPPDSRP